MAKDEPKHRSQQTIEDRTGNATITTQRTGDSLHRETKRRKLQHAFRLSDSASGRMKTASANNMPMVPTSGTEILSVAPSTLEQQTINRSSHAYDRSLLTQLRVTSPPTELLMPRPPPLSAEIPASASTTMELPGVRDHTSDQLNPEGDEYIPREFDEAGEFKVNGNGYLVGAREYTFRPFTLKGRGEKLFALATECARILQYRDSYLLFNKNRSLFKIIASKKEKEELIARDIIPYSYRSRQIAIVTARSIFRQFGSRAIKEGRRVRDDYWEAKARKQGFTEKDAAGAKRPGASPTSGTVFPSVANNKPLPAQYEMATQTDNEISGKDSETMIVGPAISSEHDRIPSSTPTLSELYVQYGIGSGGSGGRQPLTTTNPFTSVYDDAYSKGSHQLWTSPSEPGHEYVPPRLWAGRPHQDGESSEWIESVDPNAISDKDYSASELQGYSIFYPNGKLDEVANRPAQEGENLRRPNAVATPSLRIHESALGKLAGFSLGACVAYTISEDRTGSQTEENHRLLAVLSKKNGSYYDRPSLPASDDPSYS